MKDNIFLRMSNRNVIFYLFCLLHLREWNSGDPDGPWTFNP